MTGECGYGRVRLGAVDQRDPFLGLQHHRLETRRTQQVTRGPLGAVVPQHAFADQTERQMCERGEIATRPDTPLLRHWRVESRVEHARQQIDEIRSRARETLGDDIGAQQHHRPYLTFGEMRADTHGVAAHEIDLQFGKPVRRNGHFRELAETGGDSVDRLGPQQHRVHGAPRGRQAGSGRRFKRYVVPLHRHPVHIRDGK